MDLTAAGSLGAVSADNWAVSFTQGLTQTAQILIVSACKAELFSFAFHPFPRVPRVDKVPLSCWRKQQQLQSIFNTENKGL